MEEVLGARMIGGGFGGCVLVLDKVGRKNILFEKIKPVTLINSKMN